MKKVFVSYRFTGENLGELKKTILLVHDSLKKGGYAYYSTIFDIDQFKNENWSGKKIMQKAFKEIDNSDFVLFFVKSPEVSQGMLLELGYCLAKHKKLVLVIKENIKESIFRRHIEKVIEFKTIEELNKTLSDLIL